MLVKAWLAIGTDGNKVGVGIERHNMGIVLIGLGETVIRIDIIGMGDGHRASSGNRRSAKQIGIGTVGNQYQIVGHQPVGLLPT